MRPTRLLYHGSHPYTRSLLASDPRPGPAGRPDALHQGEQTGPVHRGHRLFVPFPVSDRQRAVPCRRTRRCSTIGDTTRPACFHREEATEQVKIPSLMKSANPSAGGVRRMSESESVVSLENVKVEFSTARGNARVVRRNPNRARGQQCLAPNRRPPDRHPDRRERLREVHARSNADRRQEPTSGSVATAGQDIWDSRRRKRRRTRSRSTRSATPFRSSIRTPAAR